MKNFIIENAQTQLELKTLTNNKSWRISNPALDRRVNVQNRYGKPGGFVIGDRETGARNLVIKGDLTATTDAIYRQKIRQIVSIFSLGARPYFLIDVDNDRRCEIELSRINADYSDGLEMRVVPVSIDCVMLDAYWEDITEVLVESESAGLATGETLVCNNEGDVNTYPVIEITPSAANSAFSLFNNTTDSVTTIGSSAFVPGTTITIDSRNGEIFLSDGVSQVEISSSLADGTGFMFLQPGTNSIEYDSAFGSVDIAIKYRQRYAF
jgi:phage-related protein